MIRNLTRPLLVAAIAVLASGAQAQEPSGPFSKIDPLERITVNFKDEDLTSVLELFSATYGLNIVAGPDVEGKVTLNLFEAPVKQAFEQILASNGFAYQVQDSFLILTNLEEAAAAAPIALAPNRFHPQVVFLNHVRAQDVAPMLVPLLNSGEAIVEGPPSETGIDSLGELGGNRQATREMIVLFVGEETSQKVGALLAQIDIPPPQVLVEATIMSVAIEDESVLGVDFSAYSGIDFQALGAQTKIVDNVNVPSPLEGNQLQDWLLGVTQKGFTDPNTAGLHVGIMRNQIGVFVEAMESLGQVTIMSNPQVLVLNRQPAQVLVGRKIGYQTVTATETSTVQNVQFLEVGTSLVFRPFVSDDGYVRMEIQPKLSDGVVSAQTGLPEESTTEVTTNVLIRSGNTIVIGGLMESQIISTQVQTPILGNLPVIGQLFRRDEQSERRLEIIVLLTPHIVTETELTRRADEQRSRLAASISELVASHHGYLRPSLARKMYAEAAVALAAGDTEGALAKAEFGLVALPSDLDLAVLARHAREELHSMAVEDDELRDAIELLDRVTSEEF